MELGVWLGERRAGTLQVTGHEDSIEFSLATEFKRLYPRPVLGQIFEDDPDAIHRSSVRLPPFFSNLLPERNGALRALLAERVGVKVDRETFLLAHLGEDLPGAVRVRNEAGTELEEHDDSEAQATGGGDDILKFSLAGLQLKFSAMQNVDRFTLPAKGVGGDWIIKLPDQRFELVPLNEWSMLRWASEVGIEVPEARLVSVADVIGLPAELTALREKMALAVKRFDRGAAGSRVHIEDLAQVRNVYPNRKYADANYETIGRVLQNVADEGSYEEFLRRLTFNVAIGNGDAHLKNWSLIYHDGIHAALAPAYDLVATVLYMADDELALNLARSKRFEDVTLASFTRLATKSGFDPIRAQEVVGSTVTKTRETWRTLAAELRLDTAARTRLEAHWSRVPLMNL